MAKWWIYLNNKGLRICNLYWNQTAFLRLEEDATEDIKILRGVKRGCILPLLLFNLYSEKIFNETLNGIEEGIKLNGDSC
jgi:hypothetical protein